MKIQERVKRITAAVEGETVNCVFYLCRLERQDVLRLFISQLESRLVVNSARTFDSLVGNLRYPVFHVLVCSYLDFKKLGDELVAFGKLNRCHVYVDDYRPPSAKSLRQITGAIAAAGMELVTK